MSDDEGTKKGTEAAAKTEGKKAAGRLSSFGDIQTQSDILTIDQVEGEDLTIKSYVTAKGSFGYYAIMHVTRADGSEASVSTGAKLIMTALKEAKDAGAFPVEAQFVKRNKTWIAK